MSREPSQETALRVAQIVAVATCVGAPCTYLLVLLLARFEGNFGMFAAALTGTQAWTHPMSLGLMAVSGASLSALGAVDLLVKTPRHGAPWNRLKMRTIVQSALLESVAVYGLVLGFIQNPPPMALVLALVLTPILGIVWVFPTAARWDALLTRPQ